MKFAAWNPGRIVFGTGSLETLGDEASKLGSKALLVTGKHFARKYGYIDRISKIMEESGLKVDVFDKVEPNPSTDTVDKGSDYAREKGIDLVVAFGGGSAMDAAKGIAVVAALGGKTVDYLFPNKVEGEVYPVIAIPTTAGTGSEVTKYAVITDTQQEMKRVIVSEKIIPKVAVLDPTVLKHLSPELTSWTGFDALSHAVEAYMHKLATPMSDLYAEKAIEIIFENLVDAIKGDMNAREKMHFASLLAGYAINLAGTVAVHGLGYYLTTGYGLHHGLANAFLLPYVVKYNIPAIEEKLAQLAVKAGAGSKDPTLFLKKLVKLEDEAGIPDSLRDVGIKESDIDILVEKALRQDRTIARNPREMGEKEIREIFLQAYRGRRNL